MAWKVKEIVHWTTKVSAKIKNNFAFLFFVVVVLQLF